MLAIAAALLLMAAPAAWAQLDQFGELGTGDAPLEIESDQGLELYQDRKMAVARGNVFVRRGEVSLKADTVSASYDEVEGRRTITRLDAIGDVRIETEREKLFGDRATYDIKRQLFVISGDNIRLEGEDQTVEASESLEYWGLDKRAVARGDARATQTEDRTTLQADVIEALLASKDNGKPAAPAADTGAAQNLALNMLRAWGSVTITTPTEIVRSDRAVYDVTKKVANLEGDVRITRGGNQLNGERAVIDLNSGVSRLVAARGQRVRSIFYPGSEDEKAPAPLQRRTRETAPIPRPRPAAPD